MRQIKDDYYRGKTANINPKFYIVLGQTGSGKSYLLRSQLKEFISNQDQQFSSNLDKILFISNQSPITQKLPMNGFQEGMRKMFNTLLALNRTEKKKFKIEDQKFLIFYFYHQFFSSFINRNCLIN